MIATRRSTRSSTNPVVISSAKRSVLGRLNTIDGRCNPVMHTDLGAEEVDYMDCVARVYEGGGEAVSEGRYNSATSIHAEMNALSAYIQGNRDFSAITR